MGMGAYVITFITSLLGAFVFGAIMLWWHRRLERRLPEGAPRTQWPAIAPSATALGMFLMARDVIIREGLADGIVGFIAALAVGLLCGAVVAFALRPRAGRP